MQSPDPTLIADSGYTLQDGEALLLAVKPNRNTQLYFFLSRISQWGLLGTFLVIFLALHVLFVPGYLATFKPFTAVFSSMPPYLLASLGVAVPVLLYVYYTKLARSCAYYVTNQRCILKSGFFNQQVRIIPYSQVNDISIQTSVVGKLCGLRSVCIESIGTVMLSSRTSSRNNATRMEGLTPAASQAVIDVISKQLINAKSR